MTPETNTLTNALPEAVSEAAAPARSINELQRLVWCVRREIWENRSIYIAPLAVAALIILGFFYSVVRIPADSALFTSTTNINGVVTHTQHSFDPLQIYDLAAALLMGTTFLVGFFYSLDALYGERRERSILFWKSLPISDTTTVLSKAAIPIVVLPLLTWVVAIVTQAIMLLINLSVFHARGMDTTALHTMSLTQGAVMLLYHLIAIHALWYAPIYAWLLLVSAWARKAPLMWAILPPVAIGVLEIITFHTNHFFEMLKYRFSGPEGSDGLTHSISSLHVTIGAFFSNPYLWAGLALAAVFLAAAIQLRHYRNPI
ncbi:MAG: ABC transporter permease [Acidobacteriaceae bacterium]